MKTLMVFVVLIGIPVFYLWEHAYSFKLCQQSAKLQELKLRQREVNDSLAASLASVSSRRGIETKAVEYGMEPRKRPGTLNASVVAVAPASVEKTAASGSRTQKSAAAVSKKPAKSAVASATPPKASPAKSKAGPAAKPVATGKTSDVLPVEEVVSQSSKPQNGRM